MTQSQSSIPISHCFPMVETPALLHTTLTRPNCSKARSANRSTAAVSLTSTAKATHSTPPEVSSSAASSRSGSLTSLRTTGIPSAPKAPAKARPIPDAAPVTTHAPV
jgi:hypothetical protein